MTPALDTIHTGDCLEWLKTLPDNSVHCCVTSPPYFGLRDYGHPGQIGREQTPAAYISTLLTIFREVWRVLRTDATLWLNLGDSYASPPKNRTPHQATAASTLQDSYTTQLQTLTQPNKITPGLKSKNLIGIPWRVAFALQADGWYLRQDIIWHKTNPMPESVKDRCTCAHEYIFLLTKSARYHYDQNAIKTPAKNPADDTRRINAQKTANKSTPTNRRAGLRPRPDKQRGHSRRHAGFNDRWDAMSKNEQQSNGANKRSVWTIATKPYKGAHFATFPPALIEPCILAGCPKNGTVLDPFIGSGTTPLVAAGLNRHYLGCELNPKYATLARARIYGPLFSDP